jgi:DNA-binding Lrp family transcriptional regulator
MPKLTLDRIDRRIAAELQTDARLSNVDMAGRHGATGSDMGARDTSKFAVLKITRRALRRVDHVGPLRPAKLKQLHLDRLADPLVG